MRALKANPLLGFALISFLLLRLLNLLLSGGTKPITTPDSGTYRASPTEWLDFTSVIEAKRPLVMTLTYALAPNDETRVIAQSLTFTICWSFLLVAIYASLSRPVIRNFGLLAFWLLGLSPLPSQWDVLVLSESFTISLLSASLAAALLWLKNRQSTFLFVAISLLIVAALIRPQLFIVIAILTLCWWVFGNLTTPSIRVYVLAGCLFSVGLILAVGQQVLNDANFSQDKLVSRTTWIYTNAILSASPFAERLQEQLPAAAPKCIRPKLPLGDTAGQFLIDDYRVSCPEGLAWIKSDFRSFYVTFLISDPVTTVKDTSRLLWDSAAMYVYGIDGDIGPSQKLKRLFALDDSRIFVIGFLILSTTTLVSWPYLRKKTREKLVVSATLIVAFGISWVGALLLQIADLHRTSVTSIVPINILLLSSFLIALDGLRDRTKTKQPSPR